MNKETLNVIMQFMERVQLTGKEVPAFLKCIQELKEEFEKEEPVKEEE